VINQKSVGLLTLKSHNFCFLLGDGLAVGIFLSSLKSQNLSFKGEGYSNNLVFCGDEHGEGTGVYSSGEASSLIFSVL
jgi:hypothetical protein